MGRRDEAAGQHDCHEMIVRGARQEMGDKGGKVFILERQAAPLWRHRQKIRVFVKNIPRNAFE
jgi:hypothetical protein